MKEPRSNPETGSREESARPDATPQACASSLSGPEGQQVAAISAPYYPMSVRRGSIGMIELWKRRAGRSRVG